MVIVDTEFLFALSKSDPKHIKVKKILEKKGKDLKVPISAIFEYFLVLLSKNKSNETIIEALSVVNNIIKEYDMKIARFNFSQLIKGFQLYSSYKLGLFDCLIAGTSISLKELLIGDDKHFAQIQEIEYQNYNTFIESFQK